MGKLEFLLDQHIPILSKAPLLPRKKTLQVFQLLLFPARSLFSSNYLVFKNKKTLLCIGHKKTASNLKNVHVRMCSGSIKVRAPTILSI